VIPDGIRRVRSGGFSKDAMDVMDAVNDGDEER
jgi:hypothetical protein